MARRGGEGGGAGSGGIIPTSFPAIERKLEANVVLLACIWKVPSQFQTAHLQESIHASLIALAAARLNHMS